MAGSGLWAKLPADNPAQIAALVPVLGDGPGDVERSLVEHDGAFPDLQWRNKGAGEELEDLLTDASWS
jgi:hypothetical protein